MSGQEGKRINPNLPDSYNPAVNEENFSAGIHNLSTTQKEQVIELAEASAGHIHGGSNIAGGQFGSGSLGSSGNTSGLADTLSSTGGQRGHLGQYEYTENQLDEPRDSVRGSGLGSSGHSGHSSGLSGTGDGTRQAAGSGVGGGLAATAAQQGLGSTGRGQERSIEDQRLGGLIGDQSSNDSYSRSGAGLGAGAGAAGLVGAGAYGASSGQTGHGSNRQEAIADLQGGHSGGQGGNSRSGLGGATAVGTGAGAGAGAAGLTAGQRDPSGHGAGAGEKGLLAQPQYETGLTSELERRAQKSGTHAAGFGTHGNE